MKQIYASLGLVVIGVASVQITQGQSADPSRSWGASASLRGFYDDNVNTASSNPVESFGFEVSPSLSFNLPLEQTSLAASYTYGYKWYDKKFNGKTDHDDQTHRLAAQLSHAFNERLLLSVQDSFVIGQEPDELRVGNSADATDQRIPGDNIRNYGSITFNAQLTRQFGIEVGYGNALFDYADDSDFGLSARLDRLEHVAHIDGRWTIQRDTVGFIGYAFSLVDYTADLPVGFDFCSDSRNNLSHYGYVGLEHTFRPDLVGSIRGGIRYNDYYNSPDEETGVSPYAQGNLRWTYAQESHLDFGASYDRSPTDQFTVAMDSITTDADTAVAYVALTHRIVPNLFGSVIGSYQYSIFNGGDLDGKDQQYCGVGVNLEYRFNRHVSANVGYNYDWLDSDSGVSNGEYDRNRVYVGATFTY